MRLTDFVARRDSNGDEFNANDIIDLDNSESQTDQTKEDGIEIGNQEDIMRESGLEKLEKKKISKKRQIEKNSVIEQNTESQGCCAPGKKQCVIF